MAKNKAVIANLNRTAVKDYYDAISELFRLQSRVLTGVLPHHGERGGNNELQVRAFLERTLPRKYSVGSGFIVCSDESVPPSSQTDIVIYDEFHNSPLHRELAAHIYPIECVYGVVEVKGCLRRGDIAKIGADIIKVRTMAEHRYYAKFESIPVDPAERTKRVAAKTSVQTADPPPRSFVFAFSQSGWASAESLAKSLTTAYRKEKTHIHGLLVVDRGWYIAQHAHSPKAPTYYVASDNALLQFVNGLLDSLGSLRIGLCSIERYFGKDIMKGTHVHYPESQR
jgi:hypothetical protein